jgi:uncharacterized protein (DUF58 family)
MRSRWDIWVKRRNSPGNPQIIDTRNLYILPSAFGWAYGVLVFLLLIGAINYQNNMIFLMTFLLAIIGMVSACEAHGNILNLSLKFIAVEDTNQGLPARLTLLVHADKKKRFGIGFNIALQPEIRLEKISHESIKVTIPIATPSRGCFSLPPIIISSIFPFGIFRVWSYAYFDEHYYVYPQPIDPGFWPEPYTDSNGERKRVSGDEEIYDLKQVENPWLEPKLIAWKIAARGQGWYLKKMNSPQVDQWLFKLNDLPSGDIERTLQHLSYWLQTAEESGLIYALELAGSSTEFARGKEHLQACLRKLALY